METRPRSGVYVADVAPLVPAARPLPAAEEAGEPPRWDYSFATSGVDTSLFPFKTWGRIARGVLASDPALLNPGPAEGDTALRGAIAGYLHEFRGVHCSPEQIVVGAGMEYLLACWPTCCRGGGAGGARVSQGAAHF